MIEKIFISSEKDFIKMKKTYWKDTNYIKHYISTPESYPCIALKNNHCNGPLGTIYEIEEFVYPKDFNPPKHERP